jgi:hypothetical protein
LDKKIIFCEGKNDRIFLSEIMLSELHATSLDIGVYSDLGSLVSEVRKDRHRLVSIVEGGGWKCAETTIRFTRHLWYKSDNFVVGVVGDLDRGTIYAKLSKYLRKYVRTKCTTHNVDPHPSFDDSKKEIILHLERDKTLRIWTSDVPNSLEIQISIVLKKKYPKLKQDLGEDETILAAANLLGTSRDEIIRRSVRLLKNENWCKDLQHKLKTAN